MNNIVFTKFPKISRFSREVIVTEKIDGTNAQIVITLDVGSGLGEIVAGSRNRYISVDNDNFGFAKWVEDNEEELLKLGPGRHYGEWWGAGIQRKYGLKEKRFSLFDVSKWGEERPSCCDVVPVLWRGNFDDLDINAIMNQLKEHGSYASPGFMEPEGIVVYHTAGNVMFKKTFEKDDKGKWEGK